jgi:hypothetical protein
MTKRKKDKKTNNDLQNIHIKLKTPTKTWVFRKDGQFLFH